MTQPFLKPSSTRTATPGIKTTGIAVATWRMGESPLNGALMPAVAAGGALPTTLAGAPEAVSISAIDDFDLRGDPFQKAALRHLYDGDTWLHASGAQTFQAIDTIQRASSSAYQPANGATYPNGGFGSNLKTIANPIGSAPVCNATRPRGGTPIKPRAKDRAATCRTSWLSCRTDWGRFTPISTSRTRRPMPTCLTSQMSNLGRRLSENASRGTDHGHGGSGIFVRCQVTEAGLLPTVSLQTNNSTIVPISQ